MTSAEIVKALRCISAPAGDKKEDCESCPFYAKERLDAEWAEKLGVTELPVCDYDAVEIAGADLIERLEKEKAALLEMVYVAAAYCDTCKHYDECEFIAPEAEDCQKCERCEDCPCVDCIGGQRWEWEGLED